MVADEGEFWETTPNISESLKKKEASPSLQPLSSCVPEGGTCTVLQVTALVHPPLTTHVQSMCSSCLIELRIITLWSHQVAALYGGNK